MQATIRLREYRNANIDRIKVEVWTKIGMFKQTHEKESCLLYLNVLWERTLCLTGEHLFYLVL